MTKITFLDKKYFSDEIHFLDERHLLSKSTFCIFRQKFNSSNFESLTKQTFDHSPPIKLLRELEKAKLVTYFGSFLGVKIPDLAWNLLRTTKPEFIVYANKMTPIMLMAYVRFCSSKLCTACNFPCILHQKNLQVFLFKKFENNVRHFARASRSKWLKNC